MINIIKWLLVALIVRPIAYIVLGLNIRRRPILPVAGPAIVAANHNSHLDTLVLFSLFPLNQIKNIRSVAAADYFFSNRVLGWFTKHILGAIPVRAGTRLPREQVLSEVFDALDKGQIVIIYPEGTRGEPERFSLFRSGIATLATLRPYVPVFPVYLYGLGKTLPKGSSVPVPFTCDVLVAPPIRGAIDESTFMHDLQNKMENLCSEGHFAAYH